MPRKIYDIKTLAEILPFTARQIYYWVSHPATPLPHKKAGKKLLFDGGQVLKWFDELPGKDLTF